MARWSLIPAAVTLIYAAGARRKLEPVVLQGKDESNSDVKVPILTVYQSSRVDCRQHAPFKRTQGHSAESGRPIWNASLPSVPPIEGELIPFKGLALCEKWVVGQFA